MVIKTLMIQIIINGIATLPNSMNSKGFNEANNHKLVFRPWGSFLSIEEGKSVETEFEAIEYISKYINNNTYNVSDEKKIKYVKEQKKKIHYTISILLLSFSTLINMILIYD